jgi:DNA topoisomerase-1
MPRKSPDTSNESASKAAAAMASARDSGLRYVSDDEPGLRRHPTRTGFRYVDAADRPVKDEATLSRVRSLAIPPAYRDVWICPRANGHLQATGRDARGRKQYRYHARWAEVRGQQKFGRVAAFGEALPRLRRRLRRDLALPGFPRQKVAAIVVGVMADTLVRIGNRSYERGNQSYGLTTLRNRHVSFLRGGRARFNFRGKSGIEHEVVLDDKRLTALLRRCQQLPGQHLFQYVDEAGAVQPVDSSLVNDYLRDAMGGEFSAKDFRTWGGTLAATRLLAEMPWDAEGASQRAMASMRKAVEIAVAQQLGNTPAVCRKSYIDPRVYQAWEQGWLARASQKVRGTRQWEQLTLRLLRRKQP